MDKKKISIVVPTWNEEDNIQLLVERIDFALSKNNIIYEIIFIDDHSTDHTRDIIKILSAQYPISLHLKKGVKGKAQSLLEGFPYAHYSLICMIDADLQYPPESIPRMIYAVSDDVDIVVANRTEQHIPIQRKIISKVYFLLFGKILHGFDCDIQSGLKLFKKEIVERVKIHPTPWAFDLEFLIKARSSGYHIQSINITFYKRHSGSTKIGLVKATVELAFSAIRLKFASAEIIPFHPKTEEKLGTGFHYKGTEFISHTNLHYKESAFFRITTLQSFIILLSITLLAVGIYINLHTTLLILVGILTFMFFLDLLFNLFLISRSFSDSPEITISQKEIESVKENKWPTYTILCPLYKEWEVLPQFVTAMSQLDYPKDKLQVILLLEGDDIHTIEKVKKFVLPSYFNVIVVPHSLPKTKPKALNYGLKYAAGEYCVVYDAEDIPEAQQLKKAVLSFAKSDKNIVCIQAKLNFYNPHHNILTRVFSAEYSLWFDLVLTGLQSINAPIPLGGTSNHFRTNDIIKLKGWDAFNVTEDCDLGMRLAKKGYQTAIVNSLTLEEANSDLKNWFGQRTRWIKGYMQTYLVHIRSPRDFIQSWNNQQFLAFQIIVGGKILSMFINPFLWVTTISYFAFRPYVAPVIEPYFPAPILYMGVFSLVFGNFLYMYYYMIGCAKRDYYDIIKYVFLIPFYWLFMSVAAWVACYKLIRQPHFWHKTHHGLHFNNAFAVAQAQQVVGRDLIDIKLLKFPVHLSTSLYLSQEKSEDNGNGHRKLFKSKNPPVGRANQASKTPLGKEFASLQEYVN